MSKTFVFVWLLLLATFGHARRPASFRIGSVFFETETIEQSFSRVVQTINSDENYLNGTRMDHNIQYVQDDPYDSNMKICMEMTFRVVAVFGSTLPAVDRGLGSVCSALKIPFLTTSLAPIGQPSSEFVLHLGPSQVDLLEAVSDVVERLGWKELALVSHRESSILDSYQLVEILQSRGIQVRVLDLKHADIRPSVVEIRQKFIHKFIVDVGANFLNLFFEQALKAGIVHSGSQFLPVTLDLSQVNMDTVRYTGATIIGFSLVDRKLIDLKEASGEISKELAFDMMEHHRAALLYDGVRLFARAVDNLINETDLTTPEVACDKTAVYELGDTLVKKINEAEIDGLTGRLTIKNGIRQTVRFNVIQLNTSGKFVDVGKWTVNISEGRGNLDLDSNIIEISPRAAQLNKSLIRVQTILTNEAPFMMKTEDGQYEGYLKDLLDRLSNDVGFDYVLVENEKYGSYDQTSGNWSGMIGQLVNGEADMALADLAISMKRSQFVDFSIPFETFATTILTKRSASTSDDYLGTTLYGYLNPFTTQMWLAIAISYFLTSLVLFVVGRLSPYERSKNESPSTASSGLCLSNSFWFVLAGFLHKSSTSVQPKGLATRFLAAFWWLFSLMIFILYVISLASSLVGLINRTSGQPDLDWLIHSDETRLATTQNGVTSQILEHSKDPVMMSIWEKIHQNTDSPMANVVEAVKKLTVDTATTTNNHHLGFVMESSYADFVTSQHCDLTTAGDFGERHYAIAFPKNSPYLEAVSASLLTYLQDGTLKTLRQKWVGKVSKCATENTPSSVSSMKLNSYQPSMYSILGPFLLLLLASLASVVIVLLELIYFSIVKSRRASSRASFSSVFKAELAKAVSCFGSKSINGGRHGSERYGSVPTGLNGNGLNGSGFRAGRPTNGSSKNGHTSNFMQGQSLLRKENPDDSNAAL